MGTECLAYDLGASGGRLMLGLFDGARIEVRELHRFENEMVRMNGILYWDILKLWAELKKGLAKASAEGVKARSVGIDTWGVDYGLIDSKGNLMGLPIAYRDDRTAGCIERAGGMYGLELIYEATGIQFMDFNTVFQLMADKTMRPAVYENADRLLFMPDLLGYMMTGEKYNEYTIMSTGQVLDARSRKQACGVLSGLGIRSDLFGEPVMPCTRIGKLSAEVHRETGVCAELIAVASHDTASAVAGAPLAGPDAAYLSSGTWSLLGMEIPEPIITPESFSENFTNEGGIGGSIRFLKNINGLWIIQQLRKRSGGVSFEQIIAQARLARDRRFEIDPNDQRFSAPEDMSAEIADYCEEQGQGRPEGLGELAIAVYNGLAREYGKNVKKLEQLTGREISCINMIGGGSRDGLICEMTAEVTEKRVVAGPVEGSVYGNIISQLIAVGEISDLEEGRRIIDESIEKHEYR